MSRISKDFYRNGWLQVELTDNCNLECVMCPQNRQKDNIHSHPKGFIPLWLIRKIIDETIREGIIYNEITPFWFGESLLHPDFGDIVRYISEKNKEMRFAKLFGLHTNATLMDKEKTSLILDLAEAFEKPSRIYFSLDAASQMSYEQVRKGGDFNSAMRNVEEFLMMRKARAVRIAVALQFIIQKENAHEAPRFRKKWEWFCSQNEIACSVAVSFSWQNDPSLQDSCVIFFRPKDSSREERAQNDRLFYDTLEVMGVKHG